MFSQNESQYKLLQYSTITEDIKQKAEKELNETELSKKKALEELKRLIRGEKNLNANTSDDFLLQFLRLKRFKPPAALKRLKQFYALRILYPSVFENYTPKQNLKVMESNTLNFLPLRDEEGSAVWVSRIGSWDTGAFGFQEYLRFGLLCTEKALQNPLTQICGIVNIVDLEGFSWMHLLNLSPSNVKCFATASQESFPIRHKAVHIINNPSIFGIFFSILKPFISHTIKKRIHFHGYNLESLHKHVPPSILPEEFGGTQGPFANEDFYRTLLNSEDQFFSDQKYGYIKAAS